MMPRPTTVADIQAAMRDHVALRPRGGGSKPALSMPPDGVVSLDMSGLAGVLEYDPAEFVFTAWAGTSVAEVQTLLAGHGQYLPFDPLLVERGATLGGVVAANTAGPGRYRYGGVRDFVLGVSFVDGQGNLVRGGGKVVKNAAGFDLPKLMVGSLGRLGLLVELSFKVFPQPPAQATLRVSYPDLATALTDLYRLTTAAFDADALDLEASNDGAPGLSLRIRGQENVLAARLERIQEFLGHPPCNILSGDESASFWRGVNECAWVPDDAMLIKIPLTPARIPALDERLHVLGGRRRYSVGGNVAWVAWPQALGREHAAALLMELNLPGMMVLGPPGEPLLGVPTGGVFAQRVKQTLDPSHRLR